MTVDHTCLRTAHNLLSAFCCATARPPIVEPTMNAQTSKHGYWWQRINSFPVSLGFFPTISIHMRCVGRGVNIPPF